MAANSSLAITSEWYEPTVPSARGEIAIAVLPYFDAGSIGSVLPWSDAIDALEAALADLDVAAAPPRVVVATGHGQVLLMPGESGPAAGVKVLSIAPGNPARGLPRAQGLFVLFDADTLTPQ